LVIVIIFLIKKLARRRRLQSHKTNNVDEILQELIVLLNDLQRPGNNAMPILSEIVMG
jgi:hypothetical protein